MNTAANYIFILIFFLLNTKTPQEHPRVRVKG
jgi:hypothetical protein